MKTTELFAELLVIGVGALGAVMLVLMAAFPPIGGWLSHLSAVALVPSLALIYLFGVLTDRIADAIFGAVAGRRRRGSTADAMRDWKNLRDQILGSSDYFATIYAYNRSRQRILRAWTLNAAALAITSCVYLTSAASVLPGAKPAVTAACLFVVLGGLCYAAWNQMDREEVEALGRIATRGCKDVEGVVERDP